jgi:hypothetical protein
MHSGYFREQDRAFLGSGDGGQGSLQNVVQQRVEVERAEHGRVGSEERVEFADALLHGGVQAGIFEGDARLHGEALPQADIRLGEARRTGPLADLHQPEDLLAHREWQHEHGFISKLLEQVAFRQVRRRIVNVEGEWLAGFQDSAGGGIIGQRVSLSRLVNQRAVPAS